jgi:arylsulfatase A-like enzyme
MAQGTHTIVSTPSIVASVYPSTHKLTNYQKVLSDDFVLLSELLKEAGYATFGCAANPHLGPLNGFSQGFDSYITPSFWERVDAPTVFLSLLRWLPQSAGKPFFGFLFCIDPHTPYDPPPPYDRLFDPAWEGEVTKGGRHGSRLPPRALFNMIAQYDGEIALVDNTIRQLFEELKERNLYRNTLITYTSDHGEDLYDREDDFGHGKAPYEEVVHVPLIMRFPSPLKFPQVVPAGRWEEVVSHVDILPTIAEFLHLPRPESAMGQSFLNLVRGLLPGEERYAFLEEILHQYGPYHIQAIRTKQYKLIEFIQYEEERNRPAELFDLAVDPEERNNIFSASPKVAAALQGKMEHMKALASSGPAQEPKEVELDETTLDGLRALGYVE